MRALITGGTGSLGHALVRRWKDSAERIVVFSRDEYKQGEMSLQFPQANIRYFLGDVRDKERLAQALVGIDTVIHAAALKRVDAVAYNPVEVLKSNVLGTQNTIEAAVSSGVSRVVLVSSDKAVEPANVYGASKNMAEHLAVSANVYAYPRGTRVSAVRYGNVAWSRGSVLWAWENCVASQVFPLTDLEMTRFWLTLDQAVNVIEYCLETMDGGEVIVPRLKSASLVRIAGGLSPNGAVFNVSGLRPGGEKLHEVLIGQEEASRVTHRIRLPLGGQEQEYFVLNPHLPTWRKSTDWGDPGGGSRYSSDIAPKMTQEEIMTLLKSKPV